MHWVYLEIIWSFRAALSKIVTTSYMNTDTSTGTVLCSVSSASGARSRALGSNNPCHPCPSPVWHEGLAHELSACQHVAITQRLLCPDHRRSFPGEMGWGVGNADGFIAENAGRTSVTPGGNQAIGPTLMVDPELWAPTPHRNTDSWLRAPQFVHVHTYHRAPSYRASLSGPMGWCF